MTEHREGPAARRHPGDHRGGRSQKTVRIEVGPVELAVPRDRHGLSRELISKITDKVVDELPRGRVARSITTPVIFVDAIQVNVRALAHTA